MLDSFGDPSGALLLPTLLSLINGLGLGFAFACLPRLRRSAAARLTALIYISVCLGLYLVHLPDDLLTFSTTYWFYLVAVTGYLPLYVYVLSKSAEMLVELLLLRVRPDREAQLMQRWRRKLLKVVRGGDRKIVERKLQEVRRRPADAQLHRELVELYLVLDENERAAYHAYALAEILPHGHAHALALYRLAQILVDRQGRLDGAQPYLRRIIRLYPRSFFASYARRLVNKFEASVDL